MIIRENVPEELPPDVVRSTSRLDDGLDSIQIDLGPLRQRFESVSGSGGEYGCSEDSTESKPSIIKSAADRSALQRSESVLLRLKRYQSAVSGEKLTRQNTGSANKLTGKKKVKKQKENSRKKIMSLEPQVLKTSSSDESDVLNGTSNGDSSPEIQNGKTNGKSADHVDHPSVDQEDQDGDDENDSTDSEADVPDDENNKNDDGIFRENQKIKDVVPCPSLSSLKSQWESVGSVTQPQQNGHHESPFKGINGTNGHTNGGGGGGGGDVDDNDDGPAIDVKEELYKLRYRICLGRSASMRQVYEKGLSPFKSAPFVANGLEDINSIINNNNKTVTTNEADPVVASNGIKQLDTDVINIKAATIKEQFENRFHKRNSTPNMNRSNGHDAYDGRSAAADTAVINIKAASIKERFEKGFYHHDGDEDDKISQMKKQMQDDLLVVSIADTAARGAKQIFRQMDQKLTQEKSSSVMVSKSSFSSFSSSNAKSSSSNNNNNNNKQQQQ